MNFFYLMRHGEAYSPTENTARALTEQGQSDVLKVATTLKEKNIVIDNVYHSEKCRSIQTAEIVAKVLGVSSQLKPIAYLEPDANINALSSFFESLQDNEMLVGHMPNLEILTTYLLRGQDIQMDFSFSPAECICLKHDEGKYTVEWIVLP